MDKRNVGRNREGRSLRVIDEAAGWWVQLEREDLPANEREQFIDWLRESPVHVSEMLRLSQVHEDLKRFQRWARIETTEMAPGSPSSDNVVEIPVTRATRRIGPGKGESGAKVWSFAVATVVPVVIVAVAAMWYVQNAGTIETERGERREVALADGSVIQIGPQTTLRVDLGEDQRSVVLEQGAAVFRVATDPTRPFVVTADRASVKALGTAFGVEHLDQGVLVTVAEGRVQVEDRMASLLPSAQNQLAVEPILLEADEQIAIPPALQAGNALRVPMLQSDVRAVNAANALAWAEGRLVFKNRTMREVVAEFNRYNRVQLHVADAALAGKTITGVFNASDPESFVAFVETVAKVRIERDENRHITITAP